MGRRARDISELPLIEALRLNPRWIAPSDMRTLLREAADKIEKLQAHNAQLRAELEGR